MSTLNYKAGTSMTCRSTQNFNFSRTIMWLRTLCFLAFSCLLLPVGAQSIDSVDVSDFAYSSQYLGTSGDTMKFQFELGNLDLPAENVVGNALVFRFPTLHSAPDTSWVQVADTWLTEGYSDPVAHGGGYDRKNMTIGLEYLRPDLNGQTGYGRIVTIYLLRTGGFTTDEALMLLDGGVVMVENIIFKQSAPRPDLHIAPNPTTAYIDVAVADPKDSSLKIRNLNGQVLQTQPCHAQQHIDLSAFPKGTYLLILESESEIRQQRVVKQ